MTEGYTGAQLAAVANSAAVLAIKHYVKTHPKAGDETERRLHDQMKDFEEAVKELKRERSESGVGYAPTDLANTACQPYSGVRARGNRIL